MSPPPATPPPARPAKRGDGRFNFVTIGTYGVAAAAAALSFDSLRGLGEMTGFKGNLPYALPVAIDLYAVVVAVVWLGAGSRSEKVRNWAKINTIVALGLSIGCNTLYHALTVGALAKKIGIDPHSGQSIYQPKIGVVVAVGAIPPIVLGLTIHLLTLLGPNSHEANDQKTVPAAKPTSAPAPKPQRADAPIVVTGRPVPPRPAVQTAPAPRPAVPAPAKTPPALPAAERGKVVSINKTSSAKDAVLAELAALDKAGVDLSRTGLNQELKDKHGVSLRSIEGWKADYKKTRQGGQQAAGGTR